MDCAITLLVFSVFVAVCMTAPTYVVAATGCTPLVAAFLTPFVLVLCVFLLGYACEKFSRRPK